MLPGACGRLAVMTAPPCSAAQVFNWYVQLYGPRVNLFVDHRQVVQLEALRAGLWGTSGSWGRVLTYP
jgi:phosphosulfolactate synthase (CoM biosynthesis protein A)